MKIVVFGPEKRTGVLHGEDVVDISLAFAKYLMETDDDRQAVETAAVRVPTDLGAFIGGGDQTLEDAERAIGHLYGGTENQQGPGPRLSRFR